MDWDKLRVFHAVADAGSLTHASAMLNLSQSAMSRQISALEDQMQTRLFHRHARGLLLTGEGEALLQATRVMAGELQRAQARLRDSRASVQGELRVTTSADLGNQWLMPRLSGFLANYPLLRLTLDFSERRLDLAMREADVAIRTRAPVQSDLISRPLMQSRMRLYASRGYIAQRGAPENRDDVSGHSFIRCAGASRSFDGEPFPLLGKSIPAESSPLAINSHFGVYQAVCAGLGIGALPDYMVNAQPELENVFPKIVGAAQGIYLVYPEEMRGFKRIAAFRDHMLREAQRFSGQKRERCDLPRSC